MCVRQVRRVKVNNRDTVLRVRCLIHLSYGGCRGPKYSQNQL